MRAANIGQLYVSDVLAAQSPVAAFLKGVSLLSQNKLEPAANAFRSAMRASADFYPAMVYLGACYAAGGKDKEASGAWRTALIKEGDALPLHTLLADALLRQDNGEMALETLDKARSRWPADDGMKRRFVLAALLAGEYADGLLTLDDLVASKAEDEPTLAAGLLVLYEAFRTGQADRDRGEGSRAHAESGRRLRAHGGPSMALIDTWLGAAKEKKRGTRAPKRGARAPDRRVRGARHFAGGPASPPAAARRGGWPAPRRGRGPPPRRAGGGAGRAARGCPRPPPAPPPALSPPPPPTVRSRRCGGGLAGGSTMNTGSIRIEPKAMCELETQTGTSRLSACPRFGTSAP